MMDKIRFLLATFQGEYEVWTELQYARIQWQKGNKTDKETAAFINEVLEDYGHHNLTVTV